VDRAGLPGAGGQKKPASRPYQITLQARCAVKGTAQGTQTEKGGKAAGLKERGWGDIQEGGGVVRSAKQCASLPGKAGDPD